MILAHIVWWELIWACFLSDMIPQIAVFCKPIRNIVLNTMISEPRLVYLHKSWSQEQIS